VRSRTSVLISCWFQLLVSGILFLLETPPI
jgi:hypothetical protein